MSLTFSYTSAGDSSRVWYAMEQGSGTPLLFVLHSFLPPASVFAHYSGSLRLHRGLAGGASWYMFDWRGSGRSSNRPAPPTFEDLVADVEAVANAIGEPFDINAVNDGCAVALAFARRRPGFVKRLLLISPQGAITRSPEFAAASRRMSEVEPAETLTAALMWVFPGTDHTETLAVAEESLKSKPPPVVRELRAAAMSADALDLAGAVTARTLVLVAGEEAQDGLDLAAAMPHAHAARWTDIGDGTINGAAWRRAWDELVPPGQPAAPPSALPLSSNGASADGSTLSERELAVLERLVQGYSNRRIAEALVISQPTVATHVRHILEKTGSSNRTEAAAWAVRNGLS